MMLGLSTVGRSACDCKLNLLTKVADGPLGTFLYLPLESRYTDCRIVLVSCRTMVKKIRDKILKAKINDYINS